MMPRRAQVRHIKSHRNYTIEQAASLAGVTKQTIRRWSQQGLPVMTRRRPFLIIGADLKEFIKERRISNAVPMPIGQFKCWACKSLGPPAFGLADYAPLSEKHGILHAICGTCEGAVTRFVSVADLKDWAETCEVGGRIPPHT